MSPPSWTLACLVVGKGTNKKLVFVGVKGNGCEEIHEKCAYTEEDAETDEDEKGVELVVETGSHNFNRNLNHRIKT